MGSSSSKPARTAANAAATAGRARRQYPQRPAAETTAAPEAATTTTQNQARGQGAQEAGPTVHSKARPSEGRTEEIDLDARDPHFAASLRRLGPVQFPQPTYSPSSTATPAPPQTQHQQPTNTSLNTLHHRSRLQSLATAEAEEFGRPSHPGRRFIDATTIRGILTLVERGVAAEDIEADMRLEKGVVARLAAGKGKGKGVVGNVEIGGSGSVLDI